MPWIHSSLGVDRSCSQLENAHLLLCKTLSQASVSFLWVELHRQSLTEIHDFWAELMLTGFVLLATQYTWPCTHTTCGLGMRITNANSYTSFSPVDTETASHISRCTYYILVTKPMYKQLQLRNFDGLPYSTYQTAKKNKKTKTNTITHPKL